MQQHAQLETLEAMKAAANNPGGISGMGIGMGAGLGFGKVFADNMSAAEMPNANAKSAEQLTSAECPKCHAAVKKGAKFCPECGEKMTVEKVKCPICGTEVNAKTKFCPECGAKMGAKVCKECGHKLQSNQKFCPECGAKQD